MPRRKSIRRTTLITSMRLPPKLMGLASKKATKLGLSRTQYLEQLVRKDLGVEGVDLDALDTSVFG